MAFLTKQSEQYSRLLVGQLFIAGYVSQLLLHLLMRAMQGTILKHAHKPENALIIGTGRSAIGTIVDCTQYRLPSLARLQKVPRQVWPRPMVAHICW